MTDSPMPAELPILRGPRVVLHPVTDADIPALDAIVREPSVVRWWPVPASGTIASDLLGDPKTHAFAIDVDGAVAGTVMFTEETMPEYFSAGIDIMLGSAWQNAGFGPEALRVLIGYLFDVRGHHRITIDPAVANERAIHAYERVGFKPVGVMRRYERSADGSWHDNLLLDLIAEEYVATP